VWEAQEDREQCAATHDEGIVEVGDDVHRRHTCELRSKEELCTIGDESLHEAGEGIEDAGRLAPVHAVPVADLPCYAAHGGGEGKAAQRRAPQLLILDPGREGNMRLAGQPAKRP